MMPKNLAWQLLDVLNAIAHFVGRMQQASLPRSRYIDSVKLQARRNARITIFIQVKLDRPGHEVRPASFGAMRGRPLLSSRRQSARLLQYRPRSQPGGRGSRPEPRIPRVATGSGESQRSLR